MPASSKPEPSPLLVVVTDPRSANRPDLVPAVRALADALSLERDPVTVLDSLSTRALRARFESLPEYSRVFVADLADLGRGRLGATLRALAILARRRATVRAFAPATTLRFLGPLPITDALDALARANDARASRPAHERAAARARALGLVRAFDA